jgi:nucleoside-diphosphate-sugar epimerase
MQTILGGGGSIGKELAKELNKYTDKVRIVSRNPKKINENDELVAADLSNRDEVFKAVEGSEVVYITIGFDYKLKVWREKWPAFMQNVIDACKKYKSKLIFFDNIYMYDRAFLGNMTEDTPIKPSSKKGIIRTQIAKMVTDEFAKDELTALIARSADFYGPGSDKSVLVVAVIENLKKGKPANWLANDNKIHNLTFTPDAAKATAILGNTPDAYNQVWHLPTNNAKLIGKKWVELIANEMQVKPRIMVMPIWLMGILGIFMPIMKELKEMAYQYDRDYFFNSEKFEKRFNFKPTSIEEGIRSIIKAL